MTPLGGRRRMRRLHFASCPSAAANNADRLGRSLIYRVGQIKSAKWASLGLFREFGADSGRMLARIGTYRSGVKRELPEVGAAYLWEL
jgi:hypothetical protein